jgi:porin
LAAVLPLAALAFACRAGGQHNSKAVAWHLGVLTESVSDVSGGMSRGTRFDSLLHAGLDVPTGAFSDFTDGEIYFDAAGIRSGEPSANVIGDAQVVSNIAAPNAFRVYELWYAQSFAGGLIRGRAGIIGLDDYFDTTEAGDDLINSTYGTTPTLAGNVEAPIYPTPGAAVMAVVHRNHWQAQFGVFQGHPAERDTAFRDGHLAVGEFDWFHDPGDETRGVLKIGVWQYRGPSAAGEDWGAYLTAEQPFETRRSNPVEGFVTLGASPKNINGIRYSAAAGVCVPAPFAGRPDDALSIGFATAFIRHAAPETSYEATYVFSFGDHFTVQPDVQYVVNPGGGDIPSAWVFILRASFTL